MDVKTATCLLSVYAGFVSTRTKSGNVAASCLCGGVDVFLSVLFPLLSNEAMSKELFL